MKIFLPITIALILSVGWLVRHSSPSESVASVSYQSSTYGYEIDVPTSFTVDASRAELVTLRAGEDWLRVNVGCFDFGTEGLIATSEIVNLRGQSAFKQTYYSNSKLKFIRYGLNTGDDCFYIEIFPSTEYGREVLEEIVSSFRIR